MAVIAIVGTGYVGLVTGACFADLGNRVRCLDVDAAKIALLCQGGVPIYEPGLQEIVQRNQEAGRLSFHTDYATALADTEFVFLCVDTPADPCGRPDMRRVENALADIALHVGSNAILVNKSTVPVGTGDWVEDKLETATGRGEKIAVVSCPEFLREGSAVQDFMHPDRIVLGCMEQDAAEKVVELYRPMEAEVVVTDLRTAELIKYASNAYLAMRISFVNHMARLCEAVGVDVGVVTRGMSLDDRIGNQFLSAGLGFGGSCFPKDVSALNHLARSFAVDDSLLQAVLEVNQASRLWAVAQLETILGPDMTGCTLGILGLAFKPGTDDLREAPAMAIIAGLQARGAGIKAYDPAAMAQAQARNDRIVTVEDPYALAQGADGLVVCTEWNEFQHLDMGRLAACMRRRVLIDGRNIYDPMVMQELGFIYRGVGRGHVLPKAGIPHA